MLPYLVFLLLLGYISIFWGIRTLFKNKFIHWLSVVSFFIPLVAFYSISSHNVVTADIANCCYIFCGFMVYFATGCGFIFIASKIYKKLNKRFFLAANCVISIIILIYGYINATNPYVHEINVTLNVNDDMKICFVSDIHTGRIDTVNGLNQLSRLINAQTPDMVVFGGDLIDHPAFTKYRKQFRNCIKTIKCKYGIWAVLGNHEGYCGIENSRILYKECGINLLQDEAILLNNCYLVGRIDWYNSKRSQLCTILEKLEQSKPIIVVDHNPIDINISADLNVDLHLSGHTHAGQMWPFNILTNLIYGAPTGRIFKRKNTICYITTGYGFWGSPFRIGNTPEIVIINIKKLINKK